MRPILSAVFAAGRPRTGRAAFALAALLACATAVIVGCVPPKGPMERLTDAAYDLNGATRFGRIDIALGYVDAEAQAQFARQHHFWANQIRVVDLDMVGLRPIADDAVAVDIVVTWHPMDETTIRQSQVTQRWLMLQDNWRLVEEVRSGGAPGLFPVDASEKKNATAAPASS